MRIEPQPGSLLSTIRLLKRRYSMKNEEIRELWQSYCWIAMKYGYPDAQEFYSFVTAYIEEGDCHSFSRKVEVLYLMGEVRYENLL